MLNSNKRSLVKQIYENLTGERQEKVFCEEFYWKKICEFFALTEVYNSKISYVNALLRANNLDEASSYEGALSVLLDKVYGDHGKYTSVEALLRRLAFKTSFKVNSANGNVIVLNTPYSEKLQSLKVFGRSTQDGTPSPSSPVPIETAGSNGQIGVSVGGGNLIEKLSVSEANGIIASKNEDGTFTLNGTASFDAGIYFFGKYESSDLVFPYGTYTFRVEGLTDTDLLRIRDMDLNATEVTGNQQMVYTGNIAQVCVVIKYGTVCSNMIIKPMLNLGSTPLPYEPYVTPQSLILSTPNGLPGVPVDASATEYTYQDASGQKWIADSVEYYADGTGRYVQRINRVDFSNLSWKKSSFSGSESARFLTNDFADAKVSTNPDILIVGLCNMFEIISGNTLINNEISAISCYNEVGNKIFAKIVGVTEISVFLEKTKNAYLLYQLAEPIIIPLSAEQVAEFKALTTYEPTTVIQNDAGCWMEVGYKSLITKNIEKIPRALSAPFVFEDKEVI